MLWSYLDTVTVVEGGATFRRDKKTIVCEDGQWNIYQEWHLKLKPDVRVCMSGVLGSRLPAMPCLSQWFFFKSLWFWQSILGTIKGKNKMCNMVG